MTWVNLWKIFSGVCDSNRASSGGIHMQRVPEENMYRGNRWLVTVFVSGALMAPLGAIAMPRPQDDRDRHEQEEHQRKVYDPYQKDYHNWDAKEDEIYRHWLEEKHEAFVDYGKLEHKRQQEYWKWRHEHQEHEEHEHQ